MGGLLELLVSSLDRSNANMLGGDANVDELQLLVVVSDLWRISSHRHSSRHNSSTRHHHSGGGGFTAWARCILTC